MFTWVKLHIFIRRLWIKISLKSRISIRIVLALFKISMVQMKIHIRIAKIEMSLSIKNGIWDDRITFKANFKKNRVTIQNRLSKILIYL